MAITESLSEFKKLYPLPAELEKLIAATEQSHFAEELFQIQTDIQNQYYAEIDSGTSPGQRSRRFLFATLNPMIGRPMRDPEHFYETFGRLWRWVWICISMGLYNEDLWGIEDPEKRVRAAQVNTADIAWRSVISDVAQKYPNQGEGALITEVGTGRGHSIMRLARLFPKARIVSLTISPEQAEVCSRLAREMNTPNVEVRCGNVFDRQHSDDLVGKADGVAAIEVTGHFPPELKSDGIGILGSWLKSGASISLIDSALKKPLPRFTEKYYANLSWHFSTREKYLAAFEDNGIEPLAYIDHSETMHQTFPDSAVGLKRLQHKLKEEFGWLMSKIWPRMPAMYLNTLKTMDYVQIVGKKK